MKKWAKLEVGFSENPKIMGVSDAALRLYIYGLCYSARNLTDGVVHRSWLAASRLAKHAKDLTDAKLWDVHPEGYAIHDYLKHQRSRAQIEALQAKSNQRVKRFRNSRETPLQTNVDPDPDPDTDTDQEAAVAASLREPLPTRALATRPSLTVKHGKYDHVSGFCGWMCFPLNQAMEFATRFAGSEGASVHVNPMKYLGMVHGWAQRVRDSGVKPTGGPYEFWREEWRKSYGSANRKPTKTDNIRALVEAAAREENRGSN